MPCSTNSSYLHCSWHMPKPCTDAQDTAALAIVALDSLARDYGCQANAKTGLSS